MADSLYVGESQRSWELPTWSLTFPSFSGTRIFFAEFTRAHIHAHGISIGLCFQQRFFSLYLTNIPKCVLHVSPIWPYVVNVIIWTVQIVNFYYAIFFVILSYVVFVSNIKCNRVKKMADLSIRLNFPRAFMALITNHWFKATRVNNGSLNCFTKARGNETKQWRHTSVWKMSG